MIFEQALEEYKLSLINLERSPKTIIGYLQELKFWYNWLSEKHNGPIKPSELEEGDITSFLLWLKIERNYKPASRRRVAVAIQVFLRWAYQQKIIKHELSLVVPLIKIPQQERTFLSLEQINEWINAVDHEVSKMAMWLMYYQGLRISEAINLKMDDIILTKEGGYINIKNGKGGKYRRLPIAKNLMPILDSYIANKVESDYLLATQKTGRISPVTIQAILREARRSLGWSEEITSHTLRHSFASHIYKETQDILVVSKLLGHSNLATTQIYAHLHDDRLQQAVDVL